MEDGTGGTLLVVPHKDMCVPYKDNTKLVVFNT